MIAIAYDNTGLVTLVHNQPFDPDNGFGKTKEELESEGYVLIEALPDADPAKGNPILNVKKTADGRPEVCYSYTTPPEPEETQVQRLTKELEQTKNENTATQMALAEVYEQLMLLQGINKQ